MSEIDARCLIRLISNLFKGLCLEKKHEKRKIEALMRKFRDAGRRSAPWRPTSSVVPGRPQDGADGNRILRWLMPTDHKFYATEVNATLVEVKYYLQALSMTNAPAINKYDFKDIFTPWLLEHSLDEGQYLDPVQLTKIDFIEFLSEPRSVQSGHIFPLDRGGKHIPKNTFLMLFRSNQIQGNLTVKELIVLMRTIITKHDEAEKSGNILEHIIQSG